MMLKRWEFWVLSCQKSHLNIREGKTDLRKIREKESWQLLSLWFLISQRPLCVWSFSWYPTSQNLPSGLNRGAVLRHTGSPVIAAILGRVF